MSRSRGALAAAIAASLLAGGGLAAHASTHANAESIAFFGCVVRLYKPFAAGSAYSDTCSWVQAAATGRDHTTKRNYTVYGPKLKKANSVSPAIKSPNLFVARSYRVAFKSAVSPFRNY